MPKGVKAPPPQQSSLKDMWGGKRKKDASEVKAVAEPDSEIPEDVKDEQAPKAEQSPHKRKLSSPKPDDSESL